jgi:hypothetical protein
MQAATIPPTTSPVAASPQRRRFVRDGEVPVSVIHRDQDDGAGTNKLDATRQALREQVAAREHGEHMLQEAQATEAIQRVENEKQLVEQALQRAHDELAIERASRQKAEQERDVYRPPDGRRAGTGDARHPGCPEGVPGTAEAHT